MRLLPILLALVSAVAAQDRLSYHSPRGTGGSWQWWWEFNRETFAQYREPPRNRPPLGAQREAVRAALRRRARDGDKANRQHGRVAIAEASLGDKPRIRAAAIVALGRLGDQRDVPLLTAMLDNPDERTIIKEACTLALLVMPPIGDDEIRTALDKKLGFWLSHGRWAYKDRNTAAIVTMRKVQTSIAHAMLSLTAGMRARDDFELLDALARAARKPAKSTRQYKVSLILGCGLSENAMLLPELSQAVRSSRFAGEKLNDAWRSDATYALARLGDAGAALLVDMLQGERTGVHTKRAAALGLGRLLRLGLDGPVADRAETELVKALWKKGAPILGGFAAIALGEARPPRGVRDLVRALGDAPDEARRPYVALALGLAARNAPIQIQQNLRSVLLDALERARNPQFEAALCIAVGLAQPSRGLKPLLKRVENAQRMVVRNAAVQGLGLLGQSTPRVRVAIMKELRSEQLDAVEDSAVALSMLNAPELGRLLSDLYRRAKGSQTRRALRVAYGQAAARIRANELASRLLQSLEDHQEDPRTREAAAVSLGFLASPHARDPLSELNADFNFYARSTTMHHLYWLCGNYQTITKPKTNPRDRK